MTTAKDRIYFEIENINDEIHIRNNFPFFRDYYLEIINLKEEGVKTALTKLGWSDPEKSKTYQGLISKFVFAYTDENFKLMKEVYTECLDLMNEEFKEINLKSELKKDE